MLSPEKTVALQALLQQLPAIAAARLAHAVEKDRSAGGTAFPHDAILEGLRPALRRGQQTGRVPTPLRLFYAPFEDLLILTSPKEKQKGLIARASIAVVWNWLAQTLMPDATALYMSDIKALVAANRIDETRARAAAFWLLASDRMTAAIARDRFSARHDLQGEATLGDAEEMALMLGAGLEIARIQALLPKPMHALTEDALREIRQIYTRLLDRSADAAPYVAVVAMNRLVHPWEALRIPQAITRQTDDTLISNTDVGLVGDLLFFEIESRGNALRAVRPPVFDAEELIDHLAHFSEMSSGMVREIDIRREGKWGKRLLKDRAAVAEAMDALMNRAPKEITAMLPMQKSGFSGGPREADFSKPADEEKAERGMRYARLLVGCAPHAANGSFAAARTAALEEVMHHLTSYTEDVVREMRNVGSPRHDIVARQFELTVQLTALLFSKEEADLLRRRGRAAVSDAA